MGMNYPLKIRKSEFTFAKIEILDVKMGLYAYKLSPKFLQIRNSKYKNRVLR